MQETKIDLQDIRDELILCQNSFGFIADNLRDEQASANIHSLYTLMGQTIEKISLFIEDGSEDDTEKVSFLEDVPFN